jgi:integrase
MATVLATEESRRTSHSPEVGLENKQGKIRLRLPRSVAEGSARYISTGLDFTPENHKKAQIVAWTIEEDIRSSQLDPTLERYRQKFRARQTVAIQKQPDLFCLWQKYTEYKKPQLAPTTYTKDYIRKFPNHIRNLPTQKLTDAVVIRDHLLQTLSANTAKRVLTYLSACCGWAVKSGLITSNPFAGMAADIRKPKQQQTIEPFTAAERDAILAAFREQKPHYLPFVHFLFLTGCRTGEAIALQWKHVNQDCTKITFANSYDSQLGIRKETKTGVVRHFPCNQQLRQLLTALERSESDPEALVFTSPNGLPINNTKFTNQVWRGCRNGQKVYKGIVSELAKTGVISSYRCLYNTRHTFISHCLEAGVPVTTIANWAGNSPEVIYSHYAGVVSDVSVPEW